jgi:hypothetical protein
MVACRSGSRIRDDRAYPAIAGNADGGIEQLRADALAAFGGVDGQLQLGQVGLAGFGEQSQIGRSDGVRVSIGSEPREAMAGWLVVGIGQPGERDGQRVSVEK